LTPSEFIKWIYNDVPQEIQDSCVSLWDRQTKDSLHVPIPSDQASRDLFDTLCQEQVDQDHDTYFGVCLRRPNLLTKQRGKAQDCRGLPGLFLDIDIDTTETTGTNQHAAKNLPATESQCADIISVLPEPTGIISSGFGWHIYWLFDQVQPIGYADIASFDRASESFQRKAIAHGQALGYHVDYTGNLDRVLRVPGTINTKGSGRTYVVPLFTTGPRYGSLNDLLNHADIDLRVVPGSSSVKPANPQDIDASLLQPRADHASAQTTDWIKDCLTKLQNPQSQELLNKILAGESFAEAGGRDATLQRIASVIAYVAPDRDPRELANEILYESLEKFEPEDAGKYTQQDRVEWAAEKIARAQEDARRDRVETDRHNQVLADVLLKQARSAPRRDQRLGPAPQGAYTDHEIDSFAGQQNTTASNFAKRWIIQKGSNFYVYVNGDYQKPLDMAEFENSIHRDLSPAIANGFVKLDTLTVKGEPRTKTAKEIMRDYCSVARTLIARIDLGYSYYDEDTQTFYEATCPIRPLAPQFNQEVDTWLRSLGAAKADKLLDWVATITNLTRQSCALYLEGPPGTGKTLLSKGLAKLWQQRGGATELIRVLGEWTTDLARCPLVVADEQIPSSFKGQRSSAELRNLIGNDSRTLTRKFAHNADLVGAIRLILSANNADMLVFEESLSQADLEAVAGRFLHIQGDQNAQKYLESVDTSGWVDDDTIAKHALWLRDNRIVIPGKRFLVEGSARDVSKQLATRGGVAGRVCEWLVRYLCETPTSSLIAKQSSPQQKDFVRVGNGRYLVNTNAIVIFWEQYAKSKVTPTTPQVGLALRNLSTRQVRAGTKRFFEVDIEAISQWAEANLIGDSESIQAKIAEVYEEKEALTDEAGPTVSTS
jgi:hypothetical protein